MRNIYFFTFDYAQKLPKIKEVSIEIKTDVGWENEVTCWRIFYYCPTGGGDVCTFPRTLKYYITSAEMRA